MTRLRSFSKEILLLVTALIFLSPIYIIIVNSFKNREELYSNILAFPREFSFQYYAGAMERMNFLNALGNSLYVTVISVFFLVVLASMTGWILARTKHKISKIIFMTFIATMLIPFQTIMMPLIQFMAQLMSITGLPFLNSHGGLIFMNVGFNAALSIFLYHGFVNTIPKTLEEAAIIDGCNKFSLFWRIVFPILKPITVTVIILNVIQIWNDFLLPSLVLTDTSLRTIPLTTFFFFGQFTIQWNMAMAGLVLTIIPIVIFYLFAQKHIIRGIGEGAVK